MPPCAHLRATGLDVSEQDVARLFATRRADGVFIDFDEWPAAWA